MKRIIWFYRKALRRFWKLAMLATLFYFLIMFSFAFISQDHDSSFYYIAHAQTTGQNDTENVTYSMFEGRVIVLTKKPEKNMVLAGKPGGTVYPNFEIHIFTNQHATYLVKVDNQTYKTGETDWYALVKGSTSYQTLDIDVYLKNDTGVELPVFSFHNMHVVEIPGAPKPPAEAITEPYIKMTRGELNLMIIKRVISDGILAFWGFLTGAGLAVIHTDLGGVTRLL